MQREQAIKEVDERIRWVLARKSELKVEEIILEEAKRELEESGSVKKMQRQSKQRRKRRKVCQSISFEFSSFTYKFEIIL